MKLSHVFLFCFFWDLLANLSVCRSGFFSVYWRRVACVCVCLCNGVARSIRIMFHDIMLCLPCYIITTSAYQQSETMPSEILYKSAKFTIALCRNSYCAYVSIIRLRCARSFLTIEQMSIRFSVLSCITSMHMATNKELLSVPKLQ